ncbi:SRPBCC domain-containing protein [Mucilaginibacter terrae]|uniref:SRPBCC domain-containing protein n=1 Tax=Mucilaginibacter terrae TaxID=1955052 RepID=UPI00363F8030
MSNPLIVKNTIIINTPVTKVWDVLTNPEQTPKYMFGCKIITDYQPGNPILWQATHEGNDTVYVSGHVITYKLHQLFAYTVFDPFSTYENIPENHLTVTYSLTNKNGETSLDITQGDYTWVPDGEARYEKAIEEGGWSSILEAIKKVAEEE